MTDTSLMKEIKLFAFFILIAATNSFAGPNDCDGDCAKKNFENKVLPNRKPAVVLQEEIESITKINRSPAVVEEEKDPTPEKEKGATTPLVRQQVKVQQ